MKKSLFSHQMEARSKPYHLHTLLQPSYLVFLFRFFVKTGNTLALF